MNAYDWRNVDKSFNEEEMNNSPEFGRCECGHIHKH